MNIGSLLYALSCVLFPILWGLVVVWVTQRIERIVRRRRPQGDTSKASREMRAVLPEYYI